MSRFQVIYFDYNKIRICLKRLERGEQIMDELIGRRKIQNLALEYEVFSQDLQGTVEKIGKFLDITIKEIYTHIDLKKQRDKTTEKLYKEFISKKIY